MTRLLRRLSSSSRAAALGDRRSQRYQLNQWCGVGISLEYFNIDFSPPVCLLELEVLGGRKNILIPPQLRSAVAEVVAKRGLLTVVCTGRPDLLFAASVS